MPEEPIKWEYTLRNLASEWSSRPEWFEFYETLYNGKPVVVDVRVGGHPVSPEEGDIVRILLYSDPTKKDFIGFQTVVGNPNHRIAAFLEPLEDRGVGHQLWILLKYQN